MLLAKDQKALPSTDRPVIPRRLTPEEIRQKELLQMVCQANNQILIRKNSTTNDGIDDVNVVLLGSKKVSLGDIEENKIEKQENRKRSRKPRSTPLSKGADSMKELPVENSGVCLAREIHETAKALPELPEEEKIQRKERRRNLGHTRNIEKIKKRINKLDRECALTNSEIDLSELSDDWVMESVRY
ncbi:Oidioi.mRNA.OKI2018_I69.PAR.g9929.t1.cds [Oikopleura dioica]|uniref:Oidioi.mRNA.OKI2018_I69.PAR.g9929.t1.cds n=1 Tax=Oikopleura dioica TaxID=34765 RepID=A0ABN7RSB2_OIKDI|nr:Oidioi.mRNA.OKI2018_I69.PAR.g9929.t1.cds [Oikopleura dioica]